MLDALGDPTRRAVFERVAAGPCAVTEIADGLPVSRSAVSQHLRVLKEAGLVRDTAVGTRRVYRVDPGALATLRAYVDAFWTRSLADFAAAAERPAAPPSTTDHPPTEESS
ncbi:ArsR/SmtB family transcription factor [Lapillicoccus jejuensis]|uniref:ArsR/SmtB family transcription factor n=1 Tax=Lapillicoccus jejuensis TaxID=402171 RepID=UPI001B87EDBC|nr:metalloregulator ArsR/SmtB family transcription factor [Lapillicoccus jejuensis]